MCRQGRIPEHQGMTNLPTPRDAAVAVVQDPRLPTGDDERFTGFGVMGLPFASGHVLALRDFPATTFAPAYQSVWHRDPAGIWTFYATVPGHLGCTRYFSSATPAPPVECDIDVEWLSPWSLHIRIDDLLDWRVDMRRTAATRMKTAGRNPAARAGLDQPGRAGRDRPGGGPDIGDRPRQTPRNRVQRARLHDRTEADVGGRRVTGDAARRRSRPHRPTAATGPARRLLGAPTRPLRGRQGTLRDVRRQPSPRRAAREHNRRVTAHRQLDVVLPGLGLDRVSAAGPGPVLNAVIAVVGAAVAHPRYRVVRAVATRAVGFEPLRATAPLGPLMGGLAVDRRRCLARFTRRRRAGPPPRLGRRYRGRIDLPRGTRPAGTLDHGFDDLRVRRPGVARA